MSIIIVDSGSTMISKPALNWPLCSHVHAVEMCESCDVFARSPKKDQTAPAKATKTEVVEIQPAATRGMRVPRSVISTAPASGATRQSHAPQIMKRHLSSAELRQAVDIGGEAAPVDRNDEPEPDADLRRADGHHREREDLPG